MAELNTVAGSDIQGQSLCPVYINIGFIAIITATAQSCNTKADRILLSIICYIV